MLGLIIRPVGVGQQCNRLPDGPRTKEPSIDLTNTKVRWPCNAQHQSVHSCSVFMYFHLDLCNDCYVCIFFIVCGLHTHTHTHKIRGISAAHTPHCICVLSLCAFVSILLYLSTDITKTKARSLAVHNAQDYNFKNKSDQQHQQQQLKYVSSVKQDCINNNFSEHLHLALAVMNMSYICVGVSRHNVLI